MAKKTSAIKQPSREAVQLVLNQAASAPLQNLQHAAAVDKALNEVAAFFNALMPQANGGRAENPQASAIDGGS